VHPTPWTDDHERLLADAEPSVPASSEADLERLWARVAGSIDDHDAVRRHRRRRIRFGVAVGVAVVVAGTSGLAAADHFSARTGRGPVDAEDLRLGGPGEKLALAAPDYGEVVAEETADIPFPDQESRAFAVRDQVHDARFAGTDEFVSTGAVRAWVADAALCSWSNQWAAATRTGDDAARAEAIEMVQAAPGWPAVTDLDPAPFSRWRTGLEDDGQGGTTTFRYLDESQFFYLAALGDAVEGRDPGVVARVLAANNGYCRPGNVPDLPRADPMFGER
jgi:hypothetical protein